jgi:muramidase (phage lysozyme)
LLGAGVVGAGALGMMNMQAARASQEEKLAETAKRGVGGEDKPNEFIKGLDDIIERFSDAIDGLLGGKKKGSSGGGGGSASSGGGSTNGGGGSTPDGGVGEISTSGEGTPEQQAMLKSLRFTEGTSKSYGTIFGGNTVKELEDGKLTVQETINMADTGKLPQRLGGGTVPGYGKGSKATGAYQFMPGTLEGLIKNGSLKGDELFTNKLQDRAALQLAANRGVTVDLLKKEGFSANVSNKLAPEWASIPVLNGKSYYGQPVKTLKELQNVYKQSLNITPSSVITPQTAQKPPAATPAPRPISRVEPAPNPKAREVSQAITSPGQNPKNNVEIASLPPNITVIPGGESQNRGGVAPLSPPSGDAPDVSHLGGTGNPNNPNPYTSLILGMNFA